MNNPVMVRFKRELLSYEARIKRAAYLTSLKVEDLTDGEFRLRGEWDGGAFTQTFTKFDVMGRFATAPPLQQRQKQRTCVFRDEYVRAVLAARGV